MMTAYRLIYRCAMLITSALLASCGGNQSIAPQVPKNITTQLFNHGIHRAMHHGAEVMTSSNGSVVCKQFISSYYLEFSATGQATGPFPGPFNVSGNSNPINSCVESGTSHFNEYFAITSGAKSINGTASGYAPYKCQSFHGHPYCTIGEATWNYTATLTRGGKRRREFSGTAQVSGIGGNSFGETLRKL